MKKFLVALTIGSFLTINPALSIVQDADIKTILHEISQENVTEILKTLESFQTRHTLSSHREGFGIRASAEWMQNKFKSLNPRLQVYLDQYTLPPQGRRMNQEIDLQNVIAILPGRLSGEKERIFLVNAHYDTVARTEDGNFSRDNFDNYAPGVNDDGSGVAALIEMARTFSQYEFDASLYFVAFSGEEVGLVGSTLLAERLKKESKNIKGVFGLDMIGNIQGGNGFIDNRRIRVFSAGPMDSTSRQLARYAKKIGELFFPQIEIQLIFRADRFGRGGDHTPFVLEGWPGIRLMEVNENYSRQHTIHDTLENMSLEYCTQNIRIVASILASLASAPTSPNILSERGRPMLGRGESGYDAFLQWNPVDCDDLTGYNIYWRKTTASFWEKEVFVGNMTEYVLKDVSIDEYVFGVSAVDKNGNESQISAYTMSPRTKRTYQTK